MNPESLYSRDIYSTITSLISPENLIKYSVNESLRKLIIQIAIVQKDKAVSSSLKLKLNEELSYLLNHSNKKASEIFLIIKQIKEALNRQNETLALRSYSASWSIFYLLGISVIDPVLYGINFTYDLKEMSVDVSNKDLAYRSLIDIPYKFYPMAIINYHTLKSVLKNEIDVLKLPQKINFYFMNKIRNEIEPNFSKNIDLSKDQQQMLSILEKDNSFIALAYRYPQILATLKEKVGAFKQYRKHPVAWMIDFNDDLTSQDLVKSNDGQNLFLNKNNPKHIVLNILQNNLLTNYSYSNSKVLKRDISHLIINAHQIPMFNKSYLNFVNNFKSPFEISSVEDVATVFALGHKMSDLDVSISTQELTFGQLFPQYQKYVESTYGFLLFQEQLFLILEQEFNIDRFVAIKLSKQIIKNDLNCINDLLLQYPNKKDLIDYLKAHSNKLFLKSHSIAYAYNFVALARAK